MKNKHGKVDEDMAKGKGIRGEEKNGSMNFLNVRYIMMISEVAKATPDKVHKL